MHFVATSTCLPTCLVIRKDGSLRSLEVGPDLAQVVPVLLA